MSHMDLTQEACDARLLQGLTLLTESAQAFSEVWPGVDTLTIGAMLFGLTRNQVTSLVVAQHSLGSLWTVIETLTNGRVKLPEELAETVAAVDVAKYERDHS